MEREQSSTGTIFQRNLRRQSAGIAHDREVHVMLAGSPPIDTFEVGSVPIETAAEGMIAIAFAVEEEANLGWGLGTGSVSTHLCLWLQTRKWKRADTRVALLLILFVIMLGKSPKNTSAILRPINWRSVRFLNPSAADLFNELRA